MTWSNQMTHAGSVSIIAGAAVLLAALLSSCARTDSAGDRSMTRVLGLKIGRIVIDPGHGGQDAGTIGPNGLREKDLVLDVSRRLGGLEILRRVFSRRILMTEEFSNRGSAEPSALNAADASVLRVAADLVG